MLALTSRKDQLAAGDVVHLCNTDEFLAQALTFNWFPTTAAAAVQAASSSAAPPMAGAVSIVGDWSCQQPSAPFSSAPTAFPVLSPAVRLKGPSEGHSNAWQPVIVDGQATELLSYDVSDIVSGSAAAAADGAPPSLPVITAVWCGAKRLVQARDPDLLDFNHREGVDMCHQQTLSS